LPSSRAALASQVRTAQVGAAAGGRRLRQIQRIACLRLTVLLLVQLKICLQFSMVVSTAGGLQQESA
jgi:hypothetical protein